MLLNQILWTLNIIQIMKFVYCTEDDYINNYNNNQEVKTTIGDDVGKFCYNLLIIIVDIFF